MRLPLEVMVYEYTTMTPSSSTNPVACERRKRALNVGIIQWNYSTRVDRANISEP